MKESDGDGDGSQQVSASDDDLDDSSDSDSQRKKKRMRPVIPGERKSTRSRRGAGSMVSLPGIERLLTVLCIDCDLLPSFVLMLLRILLVIIMYRYI